ncbi:VPS10 domain-containing protein [Flavilitoribacter nigricans]|uniref:Glycosyl hydrolase n=1 Tax=Flavilitoribacter nigricans (strain ATCC 23147 / DSM 23189 / NBRC 102662 / NCIMB 1420 / SS-2) TaxID=1122177 RepID=A0A2D0NHZ6_FLAN2|nr:FlgD immunoglobulin-like domain containing protein [Flavilitoribacter nigricans]PHN08134.1 glycosyl hydrolase [Flavilitoribacter nigricans DSM 23189 = NBRC 102662]
MTRTILLSICLLFLFSQTLWAQPTEIPSSLARGFTLRNLTPYQTGGRIADLEVDPNNRAIWFAAVASGNVWRTKNAGVTWDPVFDNYGSYSTGVVKIDPNNSNIVWLGTGENNAQRSVSKGDGIYKSVDGGSTWTNMGLKTSEHIGTIVVDPRNSEVVYVAAQGSVWMPGGERGLYKTTDGGSTWERILHISENTGISEIIFDPRNPDILLVSSYQRRRHPGVLVAGGPDGGIWKTTDAGQNWEKLKNGLPGGDLGRIGLAISPQQPDVVYALIAGTDDTKGFYRSANLGENWTKMSDYMVIDAQYYMELYPDPHQFDKVYSVNTLIGVTEDGGRTFRNMNNRDMHVDHHDIVFDPDHPDHILIGNDGGIYETWDGTQSWRFFDNLPLTQFYRVGIDNAYPFYNVYGGTQDNATLGGPSQSISRGGVGNSDWFVTTGGDGFQTRVDPDDPNIVYSQSQYGNLVRYDRKSQERISIKPQPGAGEAPLRWHWNAPLLISPHSGSRLYFAAERVFRSDNRGHSWTAVSDDLSLNRDRNRLEVMDRVWGVDAVFKNVWTSPMGTIVALDESPLTEGLIYAGTDDGQISVTRDGGTNWERLGPIRSVPEHTYVADLHASRTDPNTVFAVFNNHKFGDYRPYIYRSDDAGRSWSSIAGDLPEGEYLWSVYQDHVRPELLFLGAEYGLYFSLNGGRQWTKFSRGIPTIAIRDLEIQQREDDLVAASFGRGFYILDDYSPLREITQEMLDREVYLFPVREALQYVEGSGGGGSLGATAMSSSNPRFGAQITYYLREGTKTLKQQRREAEAAKVKAGDPVYYPDWEDLADERMEQSPRTVISIFDAAGNKINTVTGPLAKGIHRVHWDLEDHNGIKVTAGTYTARIATVVNGVWRDTDISQSFEVKLLENATIPASDLADRTAFLQQATALRSEVRRSQRILSSVSEEISRAISAALGSPQLHGETYEKLITLEKRLHQFRLSLEGNELMTEKMELIPPAITSRLWNATSANRTSSAPTETQREDYRIAEQEYASLAAEYNRFVQEELTPMAKQLNDAGTSVILTLQQFGTR